MKKMGERIKQIRGDMTLTEFEPVAKISKNMISLYERGEAWPKPDTISNISEFGGVSFNWLLGEDEQLTQKAYPVAAEERGGYIVKEVFYPNLQAEEAELLTAFNHLDQIQKDTVLTMVKGLAEQHMAVRKGGGGKT